MKVENIKGKARHVTPVGNSCFSLRPPVRVRHKVTGSIVRVTMVNEKSDEVMIEGLADWHSVEKFSKRKK